MADELELSAEFPDETDWIIVPRWDEFQHYKHRDPPWIRVYARLLWDPDYAALSLASKGLLQVIWLSYSQRNGQLTVAHLRRMVRPSPLGHPQLAALNHAGFIQFAASKPLAAREQDAEPETETETETETPNPFVDNRRRRKGGGADTNQQLLHRAFHIATDWEGPLDSEKFAGALDTLERELHAQLPVSIREQLWEEALKRDERP